VTEAEQVMAIAFVLALGAQFVAMREESVSADVLPFFLLGNVAVSMVQAIAGGLIRSFRGLIFFTTLSVGATVLGLALAVAMAKLLPVPQGKGLHWEHDKLGCGMAIMLGLAFMVVLSTIGGGEE